MSRPVRPGFHVMAKPAGPVCNLDCRYCFYLEKERLFPRGEMVMPGAVLETFIRQQLQAAQGPEVAFTWQGGEPTLLGLDFFRKVLELQARLGRGRPIANALQTNGVLLDDAWCAFLADHGFLVGLSLDGPRELHDAFRVDRGGRPTFDAVLRAAGLLKKHGVAFNTLTVVHRRNGDHPLEVYRFLKEAGSGYLQFIPVVEREVAGPGGRRLAGPDEPDASVAAWSVEPLQYGAFLCGVFDAWVREDVGTTFVQGFDVALESWLGMPPSLCVFQETCGGALALEHNGDLFSCDHFVDPGHRLGNILEGGLAGMALGARQRRFGAAKRNGLPAQCRACEVRFACNGECPKHRFALTPEGEPGLNHLCEGYRRFFRHIDPYMKFMAEALRQGRAPADVMAWARRRDAAGA